MQAAIIVNVYAENNSTVRDVNITMAEQKPEQNAKADIDASGGSRVDDISVGSSGDAKIKAAGRSKVSGVSVGGKEKGRERGLLAWAGIIVGLIAALIGAAATIYAAVIQRGSADKPPAAADAGPAP